MDKSQNNPAAEAREAQIQADAEKAMPQPTSSLVSTILNGMGNGAMVGVATYLGLPKLWQWMTKHDISTVTRGRSTKIATGIGTVAGLAYGLHEAKQLENYRNSVAEEIVRVRDRVRVLEGKHHSHVEKLHAGREHTAKHADEIDR